MKYLYSLNNSNKNNSILSLVSIIRVLIVDIVVVKEEVIEDYIVGIVNIDEV